MASVKPLGRASMHAMSTRQLLAHLQRLRACEASLAASDRAAAPDDVSSIHFKDDPRWPRQHAELKQILATREHVPRAAARRQEARLRKKTEATRR